MSNSSKTEELCSSNALIINCSRLVHAVSNGLCRATLAYGSIPFIGWIGWFIGFGLWAISPYITLYKLINISKESAASAITISTGSILIAAAGIYGIVSMFLHPDAQGGLIFVILPLFQWGGVIVTVVISAVLSSIDPNKKDNAV